MSQDGRGCLTCAGTLAGMAVLAAIGSCAALNSYQVAQGFPTGMEYDRLLAYDAQSGLLEGCVYSAYRLSDRSARAIELRGEQALAGAEIAERSNPYSEYRPTPLPVNQYHHAILGGTSGTLPALGAMSGCGKALPALPDADRLLTERGNYYAVSQNYERLSIISPERRLALFLYFG